MKLSQTRIAIVLAVLVATSSGCGVINRIRAKNQLNEAARAYREGRFPEAEQHSREAAALDPDNKTAPMFIARTIHAQYRPGVQSSREYCQGPGGNRGLSANSRKKPARTKKLTRLSLISTARSKKTTSCDTGSPHARPTKSVEPAKTSRGLRRAGQQGLGLLVQDHRTADEQSTTIDRSTNNKATVSYKKPKDQKDFDQAQMCVKQGLAEAENAIKFDPNNESAWSYKTNLLLEASKLAEMDGKTEQKAEYQKAAMKSLRSAPPN